MKKIPSFVAALLMSSATLFAQTKWTVTPAHAKISFSVSHLAFSTVTGEFKKFEGHLVAPHDDLADGTIEIQIDVASINTDNEGRDKDLRSDSYFDAAKYPHIVFKSTSITRSGNGRYKIAGSLTMHGITKPVVLEMTTDKSSPMHGVKVTGKVGRQDFNIGSVPKAMIGNEITITATGEFEKE